MTFLPTCHAGRFNKDFMTSSDEAYNFDLGTTRRPIGDRMTGKSKYRFVSRVRYSDGSDTTTTPHSINKYS